MPTVKHCTPNVMCGRCLTNNVKWMNCIKCTYTIISWVIACPGLHMAILVHTCCSSVTISNTLFKSQKCSGMDNKCHFCIYLLFICICQIYQAQCDFRNIKIQGKHLSWKNGITNIFSSLLHDFFIGLTILRQWKWHKSSRPSVTDEQPLKQA